MPLGQHPLSHRFYFLRIPDISSASAEYLRVPERGKIIRIQSTLGGAISGANAGILTKINGTNITGGALTVAQSGSAAGDLDETVPSALNALVEGDLLSVHTDGASTGTQPLTVCFEVDPTAV